MIRRSIYREKKGDNAMTAAETSQPTARNILDRFDDGVQNLLDRFRNQPLPFRGEVYTVSVKGAGHTCNEDSAIDIHTPTRLVVADGVTTGDHSQIAALVATALCCISRKPEGAEGLRALGHQVNEMVRYIYDTFQHKGWTTLTMAEIRLGCRATLLHIGDSRGYLLTRSLTGSYTCCQITVDQVCGYENRMYNTVGGDLQREEEIVVPTFTIPPGGILLLATDGAWKTMGDAELEFTSLASSCRSLEEFGQAIVRQAQEMGETDDISLCLYRPCFLLRARWWFWCGFFLACAIGSMLF